MPTSHGATPIHRRITNSVVKPGPTRQLKPICVQPPDRKLCLMMMMIGFIQRLPAIEEHLFMLF